MHRSAAPLPTVPLKRGLGRTILPTSVLPVAGALGSLLVFVVLLVGLDRAFVELNQTGAVLPGFNVRLLPYHDASFTRRHQSLSSGYEQPPAMVFTGDSRTMNGVNPEMLAVALNAPPETFPERALGWAVTFGLVSLGWVVFRANDLGQALAMLRALVTPRGFTGASLDSTFYLLVAVTVGGYFAYLGVRWLLARWQTRPLLGGLLRLGAAPYYALLLLILAAWSRQAPSFVYFQF